MKTIITPKPKVDMLRKSLRVVFYVLFSLAAVLILLIIIGTVFGLARSSKEPVLKLGKQDAGKAQTARSLGSEDIRVFSGLGQLRVPLSNSSTMVLSIAFPYPANDVTFTEELAAKIGDLRSIAIDTLSSLPPSAIENFDEETAKNEILRRYNAILRLGRIEALYFSDLLIIDN
jgi:flagellar basal body-associated protein FliL